MAAVASSLEPKKLALVAYITPLIEDAAIHDENTFVMWTNKQLQDMLRYFMDPQPVNVMKFDKEGLINAVEASVGVFREASEVEPSIATV